MINYRFIHLRLIAYTFVILFCMCSFTVWPDDGPQTFKNPILKGSYPDPSICRVGDTFYLVNSSFIWYPGVPIHKSMDLVNWELIGYALTTSEHLNIGDNTGRFGGIWAPTLRYHNGLFYLTVTLKQCGTSIVSTAENIQGPWSIPKPLHSQNGIDGSLLFDDSGAWYCWSEDHEILLRAFNNERMELEGDTICILNEQMFGDDYTHIEGPHIYKLKSGDYMLLIASGGTGSNNHNVSVFKSDHAKGPYTPCPNNPVLTHRNKKSPFQNIGHADIVETQNGEWYAVTLGVRPQKGLTMMDRETFMVRLMWKEGWPVFNPEGGGLVLEEDRRPNLPWTKVPEIPMNDSFDNEELGVQYNFYHTPKLKWWSLNDHPGKLRIYSQKPSMTLQANLPVIARRVTSYDFKASTNIQFAPRVNETAGLTYMMNQNGQIRLELFHKDNLSYARVVVHANMRNGSEISYTSEAVLVSSDECILTMKGTNLAIECFVGTNEQSMRSVGGVIDASNITRQRIGSYSGAYIGMFSSSNGHVSQNYADFDYFIYETPF